MKKLSTMLLCLVVGLFFLGGDAGAYPTGGPPGAPLQGVFDGITVSPASGSSINVATDYLSFDSYWMLTASGGSVATMIIELASFAPGNIFGVYSGGQYVPLFQGDAQAGAQALLSIKLDGSVYVNSGDTGVDFSGNNFGFFLDSSLYSSGGLAHSDTKLNSDALDHMYAYQGNDSDLLGLPNLQPGPWTDNEYILAFEDLFTNPDWDYTDMVVMVESVKPVPEPATMFLLGTGLIGLAGLGRKKFFKKG